jgi:release factor glutamine methyltransferase
MKMTLTMTINELLQDITRQLPPPTPRLEAEILLAYSLQVSRSYLYAHADKLLTMQEMMQFRALISQRLLGKPVAYLTGEKEFWSLTLQVNESTLIPRPETELLVEATLARLTQDSTEVVFDLGTGSGAIAIAVASERAQCRMVATDISLEALEIAQQNAKNLGVSQIQFVQSHWFSNLRGQRAYIIVSNPPYIAEDDLYLDQNELRYEPQEALVSGTEGLDALRQIIQQAPDYLENTGWLLVEHSYNQGDRVTKLFEQHGYIQVTTHHDLAGLPRVTAGKIVHQPVLH